MTDAVAALTIPLQKLSMLSNMLFWRSLARPVAIAIFVAIITYILRNIHLNHSFDVFVDELVYLRISQYVSTELRIAYHDGPFYLHPPLFFVIQAIYINVFPLGIGTIGEVYSVRYMNLAFAGLSASFLFLLCQRAFGVSGGVIAAILFALDPFVIRINSRNLLETVAIFWVLVGYYLIIVLLEKKSPLHAVISGLAFGAAILTKEVMILVVLGPLVVCFLFNCLISRSAALLATLVAITTYSVYPLFVFLQGQWHDFEWQKLQGIYRFIGIIQTTGFNQSGEHAPSLMESLVRQAAQYGTTYTIIMLGFPATLFLLRRNIQYDRFCAVASSIAYIFFLYSVLFGTNEEHYYYLVILPAIICISGCCVRVLQMITPEEGRRRLVHGLFVVSAASFVVSMSYLWYQRHFTPDNGCERLISYIIHNLPSGSRIFPSIDPVRVILEDYAEDYDYVLESWTSNVDYDDVLESSASNVEFVVVSTLQVRAGYGEIDHAAHAWLRDHAEPVFQFMGPTYGELLLYKLHDADTPVQAPVSDQASAVPTSTPATSEQPSPPPSMPGKVPRTVLEEDFTNNQRQWPNNPQATA